MEKIILPPRASSLFESMRDIGYSLESAIADIVDNSISAESKIIRIQVDIESGQPRIGIIDDGIGMRKEELIQAMRHGSVSPSQKREKNDLGRFGLGMKTASFSQCKDLTVISKKAGESSGTVWSLNDVEKSDDWVLGVLSDSELETIPYFGMIGDTGTLVLWRDLDRFCESGGADVRQEVVYEKINILEKHLSLVFHRYLSGEKNIQKIEILINNHKIEPFDPFCLNNKATQILPEEIVRIDGEVVRIQPYILPHHSKLTDREHHYYRNRSEFVSNQGVYVYRNGRLMTWGNWFRLIPKGEATKLARVQIDFTNALDEKWTIDIKKSRAYPPIEVREKLRQIISRIAEMSTRVHTGRGHRLFNEDSIPLWIRYSEHGRIRYSLNHDHPLIAVFGQGKDGDIQHMFQEILAIIEESIPVEAIYADYSTNPKSFESEEKSDPEEIFVRLNLLFDILCKDQHYSVDDFREAVGQLKTFSGCGDLIDQVIKEKTHE